MNIRTSLDYVPSSASFEHPYGVSCTVPDMSMSLKTLVARYTRSGQIPEIPMFEGVHNGDVELPPFKSMTVQERLDLSRALGVQINDLRKVLAARSKPDPDDFEGLPTPSPEPEAGESD